MEKTQICSEKQSREMIARLDEHFASKFSAFLDAKDEYDFLLNLLGVEVEDDEIIETALEHAEELPIVEVRNSISGNVFDFIVLSVGKNTGLYGLRNDDTGTPTFYRFDDITNNGNKVDLLSEMQEILNKSE